MVRSGRFHHALIFRVTEDQVTEELVAVEKPWAPLWRLQRASVLGLSSLLSFLRGERGSAISMVSKAEKAISPGAGGSSFPGGAAHLR